MREDGFTLLETLITLAVVGTLALGAAAVLRLSLAADAKIEAAAQQFQANTRLVDVAVRLIEKAAPLQANGRLVFEGRENGVTFIAISPFQALPPGAYDIALLIGDDEDRLTLRQMSRSDLGIKSEKQLTLAGVRFAYFGQALEDAAPRWHNVWDHPLEGPERVRLIWEGGMRDASPHLLAVQGVL